MSCPALQWLIARAEDNAGRFTPAHVAVLAILLAYESEGLAKVTKAKIGSLIGVGERQVANILRDLEGELCGLIKAKRSGRAGNAYQLRPDAIGNPVPVEWTNRQSVSGNQKPVTNDNRQPTSAQNATGNQFPGSGLPVEAQSVSQHAPARAETLTNNITLSESYPETPEMVVIVARASSDTPPPPAWQRVLDAVRSPFLDENKDQRLILEGHIVASWLRDGADEELDIIPTVRALIARKRERVPWGYFDRAVRECASKRLRAQQANPIKPAEADDYERAPSNNFDGMAIRRGAISPGSAILLRKIADGRANS